MLIFFNVRVVVIWRETFAKRQRPADAARLQSLKPCIPFIPAQVEILFDSQ